MMNSIWIMLVMFCPGYSDRDECRREIVPGVFRSEQVCKARGELFRTKGVSYVCGSAGPTTPDRRLPSANHRAVQNVTQLNVRYWG